MTRDNLFEGNPISFGRDMEGESGLWLIHHCVHCTMILLHMFDAFGGLNSSKQTLQAATKTKENG